MKRSGLSLFWRCFITYIICTVIFLCVELYTYRKTSALWQQSYVDQVSDSFNDNALSFSQALFSCYDFSQALQSSDYFNTLTLQPDLYQPKNSYYTARVMSNIGTLKGMLTLADDALVLMKRSGAVFTSTRIYSSADECFSDFYKYENTSPLDVMRSARFSSSHLYLLPADNVSVNNAAAVPRVTCVLSSTGSNSTYLFLIPVSRILNAFQLDSLPQQTQFYLTDSEGNVILSHLSEPAEAVEYLEITAPVSCIGGTALLRIPASFFASVATRSLNGILTVVIVCLILGLGLCFLFSHVNVSPLQDLIRKQDIPSDRKNRNELVVLNNYLEYSKEQRIVLQEQLLSNLMIRAFSGLTISEEEITALLKDPELFRQPAQIAIIRYRIPPKDPDLHPLMGFCFKEKLPHSFIIEPLNRQELGLVFPADGSSLSALCSYLEELNANLPVEQQIVCGVSMPFTGCSGISDAVQQALFSLPENGEYIIVFSGQEAPAGERSDMPELKDFQNALFNWNMPEVNRLLVEFSNAVRKENNNHAQQIFYTLLAFIKDAASAIMIPTDLFDQCTFARSISSAANILALQKLTDYLFEQKLALRNNERENQEREILAYIRSNIKDPALSPTHITNLYGRSERSVNTLILNLTGMSFSTYLLNLRMQRASELLRESDQDVIDIADQCGLALSTFYRNFKKYYHMTPADYKERFSDAPVTGKSPEDTSGN